MSDITDKIGKLLTQSEGASTEAERDAYLTKAQKLATFAAIDLEYARQRQHDRTKREKPAQSSMKIGDRGLDGNGRKVQLYLAIAKANDVRVAIARDSTRVYGYGFPSDLEVTEQLFASLNVQMYEASEKSLRNGEHKQAGVHGRTWRNNFAVGFIEQVGYRLLEAKRSAMQDAKDAQAAEANERAGIVESASETVPGLELVMTTKSKEVGDYYKKVSGARGSWGGGGVSRSSYSAQSRGNEAGSRARLGASPQIANPRGVSA